MTEPKSRDELKSTINSLNSRYGKALDTIEAVRKLNRETAQELAIVKTHEMELTFQNAKLKKQNQELLQSANSAKEIIAHTRDNADTFSGLVDFWSKTHHSATDNYRKTKQRLTARISGYHDDLAFLTCLNFAFVTVLFVVRAYAL
jgi:chromosome segregation ATPase